MAEKRGVVCPHCDATNAVPTDREPLVARCGRCHQKLFEGVPAALDAARARKHIRNSDLPVIVDFWASWCGPCRMMSPVVDKVAEEFDGKLKVGKLNIDDEADAAIAMGVSSIPTLVIFKDGVEKDRIIGAVPQGTLKAFIEKNI